MIYGHIAASERIARIARRAAPDRDQRADDHNKNAQMLGSPIRVRIEPWVGS
jgi:hypothetical protein